MWKKRGIAVLVASMGVGSLVTDSEAQGEKFPFDVGLTKPLGYRVRPGLEAPHVLPHPNNYLQPPARLKIVGANGALWAPNTFCQAEYQGHTGWIRCDDKSAFSIVAVAPPAPQPQPQLQVQPQTTSSGGEIAFKGRNSYGLSCAVSPATAMADCFDYCTKACDPVPANPDAPHAWKGWSCPRIQKVGDGLLVASSLKVANDELSLDNVEFQQSKTHATPDVIAGLKRLNDFVKSSPEQAKYKLRVKSCWRDGAEQSQSECGDVVRKINPQSLGVAWPGANPHSAGNACDIVVVDRATHQEMFGYKVDAKEATADVRAASRYLDKAVTAAGGKRLGYETWHYEWGGAAKGGRCVFGGSSELPDCDKFWPPQGHP